MNTELLEAPLKSGDAWPQPMYLNLGCGRRFHPTWSNVDFVSTHADVQAHDLRKGIPFEDDRFAIVYHSHVLEHFTEPAGLQFLRECFRVTRPGGLIRVAVPDLERIATTYLQTLAEAIRGREQAAEDYQWMKLELLDQLARGESGGEMGKYLCNPGIPNAGFVLERLGTEARSLMGRGKERSANSAEAKVPCQPGRTWWHKVRERLARWLLGAEYSALQLGRFRLGGEVHLWMYDRYSLARALEGAGYREATVFSADRSASPNWTEFGLDTEADGTTYKPDSLFMEARKS